MNLLFLTLVVCFNSGLAENNEEDVYGAKQIKIINLTNPFAFAECTRNKSGLNEYTFTNQFIFEYFYSECSEYPLKLQYCQDELESVESSNVLRAFHACFMNETKVANCFVKSMDNIPGLENNITCLPSMALKLKVQSYIESCIPSERRSCIHILMHSKDRNRILDFFNSPFCTKYPIICRTARNGNDNARKTASNILRLSYFFGREQVQNGFIRIVEKTLVVINTQKTNRININARLKHQFNNSCERYTSCLDGIEMNKSGMVCEKYIPACLIYLLRDVVKEHINNDTKSINFVLEESNRQNVIYVAVPLLNEMIFNNWERMWTMSHHYIKQSPINAGLFAFLITFFIVVFVFYVDWPCFKRRR
jgi:hypothetical protein